MCSYQACSYDLPEKSCNAEFLTAICSCFTPTGTNLIMDQFTLKLANVYKPVINPDDQNVKEMVKLSQQLNPIFIDTHNNNKYLFKWIYFASNVGTFAMYPGSCINVFDPRYRPWYIGSATGAKNFILILDFSGSMSTDNRDSILKSAVSILLKNLVNYDWVGVVVFQAYATTYSDKLVRATSDNVAKIIEFVEANEPNGETNFSDAFQKANDLLKDSTYDGQVSPCKTFIMFLTDGIPSHGITDQQEFLIFFETLEQLRKATTIFAYALGDNSVSQIPMAISCRRSGIFEAITNIEELSGKLNSYFRTLSLGMDIKSPLWVEPYLDSSGLGEMTTCSIPVYDRTVTPSRFLGVVGIDVMMDDFYFYEASKDIIIKYLILKSMSACTNSDTTECQINTMRPIQYRCAPPDPNCQISLEWDLCKKPLKNIFCNNIVPEGKKLEDSCCGVVAQACTKLITSSIYITINIMIFVLVLVFIL